MLARPRDDDRDARRSAAVTIALRTALGERLPSPACDTSTARSRTAHAMPLTSRRDPPPLAPRPHGASSRPSSVEPPRVPRRESEIAFETLTFRSARPRSYTDHCVTAATVANAARRRRSSNAASAQPLTSPDGSVLSLRDLLTLSEFRLTSNEALALHARALMLTSED